MNAAAFSVVIALHGATTTELPCNPSDLRARADGHVLTETYGPWRALDSHGREVVRLTPSGDYLQSRRSVRVRIWCEST